MSLLSLMAPDVIVIQYHCVCMDLIKLHNINSFLIIFFCYPCYLTSHHANNPLNLQEATSRAETAPAAPQPPTAGAPVRVSPRPTLWSIKVSRRPG